MGELYRKLREQLHRLPPEKRPATDVQIGYLRLLCLDADGQVDEAWLKTLTFARASAEIDKRVGKAR